jgi:hypothetical protein
MHEQVASGTKPEIVNGGEGMYKKGRRLGLHGCPHLLRNFRCGAKGGIRHWRYLGILQITKPAYRLANIAFLEQPYARNTRRSRLET